MIYFVKCGEYVKIGRTVDMAHRLSGLQTGNPYELEVLKVIDEGKYTESGLHERFKEYRVRGEWFTLNDEIKAFISSVRGTKSAKEINKELVRVCREEELKIINKRKYYRSKYYISNYYKAKRYSISTLKSRASALCLTLDQVLDSLGVDKANLSPQDFIDLDKLLYDIWVERNNRKK